MTSQGFKHLRVADGTRLAYRLEGNANAPVVVLCDGISCDGYIWRYLKDTLKQRFQVLHVHHRGHGLSGLPRDPRAVTLAHLARDLNEIMTRLKLSSATFFGHSMGVQTVLEMTWRYPARVRAGVLLNGSYGRALDTFQRTDIGAKMFPTIRRFIDKNVASIARAWRHMMPTSLAYRLALAAELNPKRIRREDFWPYLEHFSRMPPDLFARMLEDAAWRTSENFAARLQQPMLVVAADNDGFTPPHTSRRLAAMLPKAEYHLLEDASHSAPLELPELLEGIVSRFLSTYELDTTVTKPVSETPSLAALFRTHAASRRHQPGRNPTGKRTTKRRDHSS